MPERRKANRQKKSHHGFSSETPPKVIHGEKAQRACETNDAHALWLWVGNERRIDLTFTFRSIAMVAMVLYVVVQAPSVGTRRPTRKIGAQKVDI